MKNEIEKNVLSEAKDKKKYTTMTHLWCIMTVQEAAMKWELSERRVQKLCSENRIEGVIHLSRVWLIPKDAKKPADARRKKTEN